MVRSLPWVLRLSSAAGLASIVIAHSLSAYLADRNTHFSWLTSSQPAIFLNDAEAHIPSVASPTSSSDISGTTHADIAETPDANLANIRALASAALVLDPLNARALRILGKATKDPELARRFMDAAVATSRHEGIATLSLLSFNLEQKNYAETARLADVMLRYYPGNAREVLPALGRIAETEGRSEVFKLLAAKPPWRASFFANVGAGMADARTPLQLLLALKNSGASPSSEEVQPYLSLLLRNKLYDLAYYWSAPLGVDKSSSRN